MIEKWNNSFIGQLANFRVYRGALTADQASTDMNTNDYASLPAEDGYISGVTVEQISDFTGRKNQYEAILRARVLVEGSATLNAVNLTLVN